MRHLAVGVLLVGLTAAGAYSQVPLVGRLPTTSAPFKTDDSNSEARPPADLVEPGTSPDAGRPTDDTHRLVWEQADRLCLYVDKGEDGWVELDQNGKVFLRFRELKRNVDFVDLYDQARGYNLRLYKNALFLKGGNDGFTKFDDFTKYYDGQWVK